MNTSFGKQLKMKYCEIFLFLLIMIMDVSTNAQEVTCEAEQLISVDILMGHPGTAPPYKPGHILVFRCTDVKLKMYGQRAIECLSNGKWNYPYPKCEGQDSRKCGRPPHVNNSDVIDMVKKEYNTGEKVEYKCFNKYIFDMHHPFSNYLTCEQGEWSGNIKCLKPCTVTKEIMDERGIELAYADDQKIFATHNDHITFKCQRNKVLKCNDLRQQCNDGEMTLPECQDSRTCGRPPHVNNSDMIGMVKKEYNTGEKVEYKCTDKYTLDMRRPFSNYLTCEQSEWSGNIKCLKPCTVTKEIMDERGIELAYADNQKISATHNDHITFKCQRNKVLKRNDLRQQCNDGEMTLPECE